MSFDTNVAVLSGNLTRDPEFKVIEKSDGDDLSIISFDIANNPNGKDNDKTLGFYSVTAFGKIADNCKEYLKKGNLVVVTGRLNLSRWETDGGEKRSKVNIVASKIKFVSSDKHDYKKKKETENAEVEDEEDGIPF